MGEYLREFVGKRNTLILSGSSRTFIPYRRKWRATYTMVAARVSRKLWKKLHNTRGNKFPPARGEIFFPPLCLDWLNVDPFLNFFPVIDSRVSFLFFSFFFFSFYFKDRREILGSNAIFSRCRGPKGTKGRGGMESWKKSERVGNVLFHSRCKERSREFDVIRIPRGISLVITVISLLQFYVAFIKSFALSFWIMISKRETYNNVLMMSSSGRVLNCI